MTSRELRFVEARLAAAAAAVAGDSATLYGLVSRLMDAGTPFDVVLFDVLAVTQHDVGTRWQQGDYLVAEEHAATASVETVVGLLAGSFERPPDGPYVVVATAPGDHHSLPARLVAAHLLFLGFRTTFLGANVLADDLGEYLEVEPPDAVVLSCAMGNHLVGARAAVRASHAVGAPVIVGGRGFGTTGQWATAVGADAWTADPRQVAGILQTWNPVPADAEARAVEPSRELRALIDGRAAVIASAQQHLVEGGVETGSRVIDELVILLGAVEAALFAGDDELVADTLAWQRHTLAAHGVPVAQSIAEAVRTALAAVSPDGERLIGRALARA